MRSPAAVETGDRVLDPLSGEWREVVRIEGDTLRMDDGGVMGIEEAEHIVLPGEEPYAVTWSVVVRATPLGRHHGAQDRQVWACEDKRTADLLAQAVTRAMPSLAFSTIHVQAHEAGVNPVDEPSEAPATEPRRSAVEQVMLAALKRVHRARQRGAEITMGDLDAVRDAIYAAEPEFRATDPCRPATG